MSSSDESEFDGWDGAAAGGFMSPNGRTARTSQRKGGFDSPARSSAGRKRNRSSIISYRISSSGSEDETDGGEVSEDSHEVAPERPGKRRRTAASTAPKEAASGIKSEHSKRNTKRMQARGAVDDDEPESSDSGDGSSARDSDSVFYSEASEFNDSDSDFDASSSHRQRKGGSKLGKSSAGKKSKASKSAANSKKRAGSSAASESSMGGASASSSKSTKPSTTGQAAKAKNGSAGPAKKKRVPGSKPAAELPLTLASRKPAGKATVLVSSEHPIDLEGEVGAVGCVTMAGETLVLDIAGHRYRARPVPVQSHCVLHVTDKEAKIESIANVCLQLDHLADVVQELGGSLGEAGAGIDAKALFASVEAEAGVSAVGSDGAGKSGGRKGRASSTTASSSSSSSSTAASGPGAAEPAVLGSQAVAAAQELEMIGRARSKGRSKKRKH